MNEPLQSRASVMAESQLREVGLRVTRQRVAVLAALLESEDHPTADEMLSRVRHRDDSISLATAYRNLAVLVEAGLVRKLALENGSARYEMRPATDHDHLLDVETGALTELVSPELDVLRERLLADLGLELVSCHSVIRVRRLES
jgi:Fur family transcriptional regulator, ferric uptake regulator